MHSDTEVVRIAPAGDAALVVEFPSRIDPEINGRAVALAHALRANWEAILRDVVVAYCTLTVYFDPVHVDGRWLESELARLSAWPEAAEAPSGRLLRVPVCYQGDFAPDIDEVAAFGACSIGDVIALHTAREYRVYMLGFLPGFAYMAEVDPRIAAPRRATPRTSVPTGAVAIAGGQTGIYPTETPGGWNIIGRTPVRPFDRTRTEAFLFRTADRVEFVPISRNELERMR